MSIIAVAVKHLISAGIEGDDLIAIIAEMEAAQQSVRSKGAIRQARYMERKASQNVINDENDAPLSPSLSPPNPQTPNPIPPKNIYPAREEADRIVQDWNEMAGRVGLSAVRKLTPDRRSRLRSRLGEHGAELFTEAIAAVERSPFCRGDNRDGWRANFDFLLQPKSFMKLVEGNYDPTQRNGHANGKSKSLDQALAEIWPDDEPNHFGLGQEISPHEFDHH